MGLNRSTRVRTSFAASSRFVPHSKRTWTRLWPSDEVDSISSTPGAELTARSMGRVISVSISSGATPGYSVDTVIVGNSMSGIRSTGSSQKEMAPRRIAIEVIM
jgi:hypothetical protein